MTFSSVVSCWSAVTPIRRPVKLGVVPRDWISSCTSCSVVPGVQSSGHDSTDAIRGPSTTLSRAPGAKNSASAIRCSPSGSSSCVRSTAWLMVRLVDQISVAGAAVAATLARQSAAES